MDRGALDHALEGSCWHGLRPFDIGDEGGKIVIDEVDGLGTYCELEISADEHSLTEAKECLQAAAAELGRQRRDLARDHREFAAAVEKARIDSPRGAFSLSKAHNPVQDIYLRQVVGKENKVVGIASKSLADPGRGCRM